MIDDFSFEATDIFGPFFEELGFTLGSVGPQFVEFRSACLQVRLFQGKKSNTIGVEITRDGDLVNLPHLLDASGDASPGMTVGGRTAVRERLTWLRRFISSRFDKLLSGDAAEFRRLVSLARLHDERYNFESVAMPEIERANAAFHERRYAEVVQLLEPFEAKLSAVAKRKLAFARSAVSQGS